MICIVVVFFFWGGGGGARLPGPLGQKFRNGGVRCSLETAAVGGLFFQGFGGVFRQ